jgi:hypothetical protein
MSTVPVGGLRFAAAAAVFDGDDKVELKRVTELS